MKFSGTIAYSRRRRYNVHRIYETTLDVNVNWFLFACICFRIQDSYQRIGWQAKREFNPKRSKKSEEKYLTYKVRRKIPDIPKSEEKYLTYIGQKEHT